MYKKFDIKGILKSAVTQLERKVKLAMKKGNLDRNGFFMKHGHQFPISRNTYSKYKSFTSERAKFDKIDDMSLAVFYSICTYTDVSADYLLGFIESERKEQSAEMVKNEFGLTDEAMARLIIAKSMENEHMGEVSSDLINLILENDNFWLKLDEFLPIYIADKYEHNSSVLEVGMVRYSLINIFEQLIDEICDSIYETSSLKPLPQININPCIGKGCSKK